MTPPLRPPALPGELFSGAAMYPLLVLIILLVVIPFIISVGMTYFFCIKKP